MRMELSTAQVELARPRFYWELARHLFEEGFYDQTCFKNIIWVSAKENYYNPILDVVEPGAPRIKSLDNVLTAILDFHEFEDPSGYDRESKKVAGS